MKPAEFEVLRGFAEIEGALYYKGSSFSADPNDKEVKSLLQRDIIAPVEETKPHKKARDAE